LAEESSYLAHFGRLDDHELVDHWRKHLMPDARAALRTELQRRNLVVPEAAAILDQDDDSVEPRPSESGSRTTWWRWLKAYGALSPVFVVSVFQNAFGVSTGLVPTLILAGVGYSVAVVWILKTQSANPPWGRGATVASFLLAHSLVMFGLMVILRTLWAVGHR
jgi:hypothetical protein